MRSFKLTSFIIFVFISMHLSGQELSKFKWKNRIILLQSKSEFNEQYLMQLNELKKDIPGLVERKLLVFSQTEQKFKREFTDFSGWVDLDRSIFVKPFQFILIGLDGNVKFRSEQIVSTEQLYEIIDSMPMRRIEIKQNKKAPNNGASPY